MSLEQDIDLTETREWLDALEAVQAYRGPARTNYLVNRLVAAGIQGVLNFSPIVLEVSPDVTVNNVDLALELEHLSYFIR